MMKRIGIAGSGRIACALGRLLRERGADVAAVASRRPESAEAAARFIGGNCVTASYADLPHAADRLLIAVADDALTLVATQIAPACGPETTALHTCGRYGATALNALAARGASCGSLHPLQTVATPEQGIRALPGCAFAVDGSGAARCWAQEIADLLGGAVICIGDELRPTYHAAAVMASNYLVGILDASATLMQLAGVDRTAALAALGPLARTTLENCLAIGPPAALTGPIERGDSRTVAAHLQALRLAPPSVAALYRAAGKHVTFMARQRHPDRAYTQIEQLLENEDG